MWQQNSENSYRNARARDPLRACTLPPIPSRFFPQTVPILRENFPTALWKLSWRYVKAFMMKCENFHDEAGKLSWTRVTAVTHYWRKSHKKCGTKLPNGLKVLKTTGKQRGHLARNHGCSPCEHCPKWSTHTTRCSGRTHQANTTNSSRRCPHWLPNCCWDTRQRAGKWNCHSKL